ncbi:class I SAM-dependent methyltransferase [Paenibacillus sp. GSMTC-2017]|uniref:class I SAM-dependent methyltransferase n=1 Tax=Paenibacillus sp. GSMTC-2017 TaxID=2794350 RepID=UPI0018D873DF|nr:class I SAM-dependent methyltransferase [Paenibacillus sp. GSMTC-2017]MBH5316426.1 class I SAM-dependent methyltransferase [Paenibacillus sp. GSMTC-2017]
MTSESLYDVWWQYKGEGEQGMEDDHLPHWKRVLSFIPVEDLSESNVFDFGCNQGGFLRLLYEQRPFKEGVGTDLARQSIEVANRRKGNLPIHYFADSIPEQYEHYFDYAFSLAVIYLLPDLDDHALKMKKILKPGGVYYATFADYTGNPSLPSIRDRINSNATLPMQKHTIDTVADAFFRAGFKIGIRRMIPADFVDLSQGNKWYNNIADHLQYAYEQAFLFRFVAPSQDV